MVGEREMTKDFDHMVFRGLLNSLMLNMFQYVAWYYVT